MANRKKRRTTKSVTRKRSHVSGHTSPVRRRRKRRSAMSGVADEVTPVLGVIVGLALGNMAGKMIPISDPKIKGAAKVLIGALAPKVAKGNAIVRYVGLGVAASGAMDIGKVFLPQFFAGIGDGDPVVLIQGLGSDEGGANTLLAGEDMLGEIELAGLGMDDDGMGSDEGGANTLLAGSEDQLGGADTLMS